MKDQAAHRRFILSLGVIIALGPLSIDMYLPSLPAIGQALAADAASVQMSVSAYFVGLAIGQLVYGPITDRFGRRKPLLFGLALFSVASLGCAFAGSIGQLIAFRGLQALGGCAGIVISRALVRDHYSGNEMARALSSLMLVMGVAPVLAPTLGGKLQLWFGWHSIFLLLAVFGCVCLLITALRIAEPQREPLSPTVATVGSSRSQHGKAPILCRIGAARDSRVKRSDPSARAHRGGSEPRSVRGWS